MVHIPIWLLVAGILVLAVPAVYFVYDAFCKPEDVNPGMIRIMRSMRIMRITRIVRLYSQFTLCMMPFANLRMSILVKMMKDYEDFEDVPAVYFVYDAFRKLEDVNPGEDDEGL